MAALENSPSKLRIVLDVDIRQADLADEAIDLSVRCGRGGIPGRISVAAFRGICLSRRGTGPCPRDRSRRPSPAAQISADQRFRRFRLARMVRRASMDYHPRPQDRRFEDYNLVLDAAAHGLGIALARPPLTGISLSQAASSPSMNARH